MMRFVRLLQGNGILRLALVGGLLAAASAWGQIRSNPEDRGPLDPGEMKREDFSRLTEYKKGDSYSKDAKFLEKAAKWYAFRMTQPAFQEFDPTKPTQSMKVLVEDLFRQLPQKDKQLNENQRAYLRDFHEQLVKCLKRVVNNDKPIAQINAARCLAHLAEWGQEEIGDALAEIVKDDGYNDAVKLHALQGLKILFSLENPDLPKRSIFKDAGREAKCILAILEFLQRKSPLSDTAPAEDQEGLRYVRREAIRALGQTRYPAVINAKTKEIEGQTAYWLLKVVRKDGLKPEPNLSEQVEAAVGVCQLQPALIDKYNVDFTAYHVGQFIKEFVRTYKADAPVPWRTYGARLGAAISDLKTMATLLTDTRRRQPQGNNVSAFADNSVRMLALIEKKGPVGGDLLNSLSNWLQTYKGSATAYEGIADAVIKETEPAAPGGN